MKGTIYLDKCFISPATPEIKNKINRNIAGSSGKALTDRKSTVPDRKMASWTLSHSPCISFGHFQRKWCDRLICKTVGDIFMPWDAIWAGTRIDRMFYRRECTRVYAGRTAMSQTEIPHRLGAFKLTTDLTHVYVYVH